MTDQLSSFSCFPSVTINPPVTLAIASTPTGQIVADCFATDAASITDAFTGETCVKDPLGGNFTQISF